MTNHPDIQYRFGLKIGEKGFHVAGDKIWVETQMEKWLNLFQHQLSPELLGTSNQPAGRPVDPGAAPQQRKLPTLGEFLQTKGCKEIPDVILVVGLYFERFQQKNLFTRSDLMQTIFNRISKDETEVQQALVDLVNRQLLGESATMGSSEMSYSLTFTGEQLVKEGFTR